MSENYNIKIGYAYVPMQIFRDLYSYDEALQAGTLFKELDIPAQDYVPGGKKDE